MKKLEFILTCLTSKIKNYFFIKSKTDISHECEKFFVSGENVNSQEGSKLTEEYIENYRGTTRWQTI